jgi:hypothetical protein
MDEKQIIWNYENFPDIKFKVQERMEEKKLDSTNPNHIERIKDLITEVVLQFRNNI